MSTLTMSACSDSSSNPFIDYAHDTAYVGDDCGSLHKITPVFTGTPVEVVGNGWPVQLGTRLYSPVYDSVSGRVLVTTTNTCALYVVDAASGVVLKTDTYSCFTQSDVIVDSTNQTAYVFFAASPTFNLTVAQFDTSGTLLSQVAGGALAGNVNVFTGTFDHNYFNNPSTGALYFAGAVNGLASLYRVGFTGRTMNPSLNGPLVLTTSQFGSTPGRLTEIFNPSLSTAQDRLFLGIDGNCAPSAAGQGDGCIESLDISNGFPSGILNSYTVATRAASLSISGLIMDNVSSSPQASSIYFDATVLPNGSAFKLTQSGLQ